ncbi:MAG: sugar ABC transporter permease [Clostridiales bacterium]|jgi:raffinose/stachyose/melibiose transport system permease protein|nr:sugar ABC transporter permease [Clostridiales bacterium]
MAVPALLLFVMFFIYPLTQGIGLSLTDWDGFSPSKNFIGLANFQRFFTDKRAVAAVQHSIQYGFIVPIGMNILGFIYALLLDQKLVGKNVARVVVYLPAIVSSLIIGYIWKIVLFTDGGALKDIMTFLGVGHLFRSWLSYPQEAMWVVIIINIWQHAGSVMIIYLAGMQSIPQELFESSTIDGANYWQNLFNITMPLLIPAIKINVITNLINSLAVYDSIVALTEGGPGYATESVSMLIYRLSYGSHTGYATAIALILLVIIMIPTLFVFSALNKKSVEI